jgi:hypothetical protein
MVKVSASSGEWRYVWSEEVRAVTVEWVILGSSLRMS